MNTLWKNITKKLLQLVVFFTALVSFFFYFLPTGIAQKTQPCYTVDSTNRLIFLSKICNIQDLRKVNACQGPFDDDGFPLALSVELERLKQAVADVRKREMEGYQDPATQAIMAEIFDKMSFPKRVRLLLQEQQQILLTVRAIEDSIERQKVENKYAANVAELIKNKCFVDLINSLHSKKGLGPLIW